MGRECSAYGGEQRLKQGLMRKPEEKFPFERPRRRWEDNIRWIFRKWDVGVWTGLGWLRIETVGGHL
jgi:hypothetical protein